MNVQNQVQRRNQRVNRQGQAQAGPQNAAVQGGNQGNQNHQEIQAPVWVSPLDSNPPVHLSVRSGVETNIQDSKIYSPEATEILRKRFFYLSRGAARDRFRIGGDQGHKMHPHALGAFLRSYYFDQVAYKYATSGSVLDIGSSLSRLNRYEQLDDNEFRTPLFARFFASTPMLDVRDYTRRADNYNRFVENVVDYDEKVREHNEHVDPLQALPRVNAGNRVCQHAIDQIPMYGPHVDCQCQQRFDHYLSCESIYYPGVLDGILQRLERDQIDNRPSDAYVIFNNYGGRLLQDLADKQSDAYKQLKEVLTGVKPDSEFSIKYKSCVDIDGTPEGIHTIKIDQNGNFRMHVDINGNYLPYTHDIPRFLNDEFFIIQYSEQSVMIFERLDRVMNGDVPFDLYKIRSTPRNLWTEEQLTLRSTSGSGFFSKYNILGLVPNALELVDLPPVEIPEMKGEVKLEALNNDTITNLYLPKFQQLKKTYKGKETNVDYRTFTEKVTSEIGFVNWLRTQFGRRNYQISFRVQEGTVYIILRNYTKTFFWFTGIDSNRSAMAPVSEVVDAYIRMGIASNTSTIRNKMANEQKVANNLDYSTLTKQEAYIIARVIRIGEEQRWADIVQPINVVPKQ